MGGGNGQLMYTDFSFDDKNVLELDKSGGCTL